MSSESPAAHLARLKVSHPLWTIWRATVTADDKTEFHAMPPKGAPQVMLSASTVPVLEIMITEADRGPGYER